MKTTNKLYIELLRLNKIKILLSDVVLAFFEAYPYLQYDPSLNRRLGLELDQLRNEGLVEVPRGEKLWDYSKPIPLPQYIKVVNAKKTAEAHDRADQLRRFKRISWHPLLSFVGSISNLGTLSKLETINKYLLTRSSAKGARIVLPIKERSLMIFGEEKALDDLRGKSPFKTGDLSLSDLDCFYVPEPLPYEPLSWDTSETAGKKILVIENSNTYWSFCRWNRSAKKYAAIAYGKGKQFNSVVDGIDDLLKRTQAQGIEYFGDIDPAGIQIPYNASVSRSEIGAQSIEPALFYFELLLKINRTTPLEGAANFPISKELRLWIKNEEMNEKILGLFQKKLRLPQEAISLEVLTKLKEPI